MGRWKVSGLGALLVEIQIDGLEKGGDLEGRLQFRTGSPTTYCAASGFKWHEFRVGWVDKKGKVVDTLGRPLSSNELIMALFINNL